MKKILLYAIAIIALLSCEDDSRDTDFADNAALPSEVSVSAILSQDNSGEVILTPQANSASRFLVDTGLPNTEPIDVLPGENIVQTYSEGNYQITITAFNINDETATATQPLVVSFLAPQNLEVAVEKDPSDTSRVSVSATADLAAGFNVFFGDTADEEPTILMTGETIQYRYDIFGQFDLRVVALSGGTETTEETVQLSINLETPLTFESAIDQYNFTNFEGAETTVVTNPDQNGNESNQVGQYIKTNGAQFFAGSIIDLQAPIDFAAGNNMKMKVWSPTANAVVRLKIENSSDPAIFNEVDAVTSVINEWEELLFDFSTTDFNQSYDRIVVFFDFANGGDGSTYYFDDIQTTSETLPVTSPVMAAATPLVPENLVVSMFSDAYTDVTVDTWNTSWSDATFEDITINGNSTKQYTNLNFNGIETVSAPLNLEAANVNTMHLDVWTPNITDLRIKLVDFGQSGFGGGDDTEVELTFNPTQGEWVSIDIPLSDFSSGMNLSDVNQFIISADPTGQSTLFIDNVYFYQDSDAPTTTAPTPTQSAANVISMFSDAYTDVPVDTWNTSWSDATFEDISVDGNATKLYTNLNFNGIETVANPIDLAATGMTMMRMDVWTNNITEFRIKLVDFGGDGFQGANADTEVELAFTPALFQWVSIEIPISDFSAGMNISDINQLVISGNPAGGGTIYIDNVYFYN